MVQNLKIIDNKVEIKVKVEVEVDGKNTESSLDFP
jgi:hypothetical protein